MKAFMMSSKAGGKSPHCKVCGDDSSGFHYGVDSCEGCKGFFRRCITQGMTHKCANEEKCEITAFTRNSCQYCRLKKCFQVGMSREASRLGRRPKRLKDSGGSGESSRTNLPIAPYPSPQEVQRSRMADLQKLLQAKGTFKDELMQAFLSAAQQSFREHSKSGGANTSSKPPSTPQPAPSTPAPCAMSPELSLDSSLLGGPFMTPDLLSMGGSPVPSPFPDLTASDLSPMTPGGLGQLYDTPNFLVPSNGTAGAQHSSGSEAAPSPLAMPGLDALDPCSPSTFLTFSNQQLASPPEHSPLAPSPSLMGAAMPLQGGVGGAGLEEPSLMPLHTIKQEIPEVMPMPPEEPVVIKIEPSESLFACIPINQVFVRQVMEEVTLEPPENRRLLISQVTDAIVEAHMATTINIYANVAKANEEIKKYNPINDMMDMSHMTVSAPAMWQQFLSALVPEITKVVKFCKKLPGFCEIVDKDQMLLIKQGTFEVMVARFCILVDHINEEMLDPYLKMKSPRKVIQSLPLLGQFLDEFFDMAKLVNPLELTDGEIGLFTAILMFCPSRNGLQGVQEITTIRKLYLQALFMLMNTSHKDASAVFSRLISLIPAFHKINEDHSQFLNSIKMKGSHVYNSQFPQLHREVFE